MKHSGASSALELDLLHELEDLADGCDREAKATHALAVLDSGHARDFRALKRDREQDLQLAPEQFQVHAERARAARRFARGDPDVAR